MKNILLTLVTVLFFSLLVPLAEAGPKHKSKPTKPVPIGKVVPRIGQNYKPGLFTWASTEERIAAYKQCMFPEEGRLERALVLNFAVKDSAEMVSDPRQLAYEVCLSDARCSLATKTCQASKKGSRVNP